jgi:hypothetical protein
MLLIHRARNARNFFSASDANFHQQLCTPQSCTALSKIAPQSRMRMATGFDSNESAREKGIGMSEKEERLAEERKEIAARVASFRATQEKFEREREEFFVTTLQNARLQNARGIKPIPFWS